MAVTIETFANGDTNYIAKHNSNAANLKAAVEALQNAIAAGTAGGGSDTVPVLLNAMYSADNVIIGEDSYVPTQSASDTLAVSDGYAYVASADIIVEQVAPSALNFAGQTTGTYYVHVDPTGTPTFDSNPSDALYSVDYDQGTGDFSNIVPTADVSMSATDYKNALSNIWAMSYATLDARIDGAENAATGILQKPVVATNITLSDTEAFEQGLVELTDGPQTADIELIVPPEAKVYTLLNNTTGANTVTLKVDGFAGVVVPKTEFCIIYVDGANSTLVFSISTSSGGGSVPTAMRDLSDTPPTHVGFADLIVAVKNDETGVEYRALTESDISDLQSYILASGVTFDNLTANSDVGTGATQVAAGDHTHAGYAASSHDHLEADITDLQAYLLAGDIAGLLSDITGESVNDLSDTPANFTAQGGYDVRVNGAADALEYVQREYFIGGFFPGAGVISSTMMVHVFAQSVTIPSGMTGSYGTAEAAATSQTDYDVKKNGTSVGTMRFAAAATTATFIMATETSFAAGDKLQLVAPGTLDATLVDISINFKGTL